MSPGANYTPDLLGVTWALTTLSALFVSARFFCRFYVGTKFGWDDFWAAFSLLMSFAMSISWSVYAQFGGTHDVPHTPEQQSNITFVSWLSQTWCITGIITTKIAVAALIMRLQGPSVWRTRILWVLCSVSAAWAVVQIGLVWGSCHPVNKLWDPRVPLDVGRCLSPTVVVYNGMACSSFWAFVDIALAVIPIQMIVKLQLPLKKKIGICILLSTGLFAAAMSIVRTTKLPADLQRNSDIVHEFVMFFIWNALEINSLTISCCVPTLMPLWEIARGRGATKYGRSTGSSGVVASRRSYAMGTVGRKSKPNTYAAYDTTLNSSQDYIKIEPTGKGKAFDESSDGFETSITTEDHSVSAGQGIKVTHEVNVSNTTN